MGLSHVPLANAALDALEDWSSHIPLETMQPCYTIVLPLLDGYLKTASTNSKRDRVDGRALFDDETFTVNKKSNSEVLDFRLRRQQLGGDVFSVFTRQRIQPSDDKTPEAI